MDREDIPAPRSGHDAQRAADAVEGEPRCRRYTVRAATAADLPDLVKTKGLLALHRDRLLDADAGGLLYAVIEEAEALIGFGLLVFERPSAWSDAGDTSRLPAMVDLFVSPSKRGRGAGSQLIHWMEDAARSRGYSHLYLGVDPVDNPRAYRLYRRLGYEPLQTEPHRLHWRFVDSGGHVHEGDEWNVDMVRALGGPR